MKSHTPLAHCIHADSQFSGDLPVPFSFTGCQNHARSLGYLLGRAVSPYEGFQFVSLGFA
jgi:hypothetical protein